MNQFDDVPDEAHDGKAEAMAVAIFWNSFLSVFYVSLDQTGRVLGEQLDGLGVLGDLVHLCSG